MVGAGMLWFFEAHSLKTSPSAHIDRELSAVKAYTLALQLKNEHPPSDLKGLMADWEVTPEAERAPDQCRHMQSGKDSWGTRFYYKFDAKTEKLVIRSFGPNKKDEKGKGDDLHREYDLRGLPL